MDFIKDNYSWNEDAVTVFDCHSPFMFLHVIMWSCVNTVTGLGVGFSMNTAPKTSQNIDERWKEYPWIRATHRWKLVISHSKTAGEGQIFSNAFPFSYFWSKENSSTWVFLRKTWTV